MILVVVIMDKWNYVIVNPPPCGITVKTKNEYGEIRYGMYKSGNKFINFGFEFKANRWMKI